MTTQLTGGDVLLYLKGYHWTKEELTWAMVPELAPYADAIRAAIGRWDDASDLDFKEVGPSQFDDADIKFVVTTHEGYDGYTYLLVDDADRTKITDAVVELPTNIAPDQLDYVVTHEFGHAIGLKHPIRLDMTPASAAPHAPAALVTPDNTVMGYYDDADGHLGKWDLQAINELYGPERDKAVADTIYGGDAVNQLLGGPGHDMLFGNGSDDFIYGGRDNDTLFGGRGNDIVSGDAGDDDLSGDAGDDVMTGGAGRDIFRVGLGNDVITDFVATVDRIVATGEYHIVHEGADTLLVGNDWSARLVGVADFA